MTTIEEREEANESDDYRIRRVPMAEARAKVRTARGWVKEEVISETVEPRNPDYPVDPDFDPLDPEALENLKKGVRVTPTTSTADLPSTSARELTQRIPDLRLSPPDQRFEFDPNMSFRGPKELWAELTPVRATSGATSR